MIHLRSPAKPYELAYAEYVGPNLAFSTAFQDVPGVNIVVPAGVGPYMLRWQSAIEVTATAAAAAALCSVILFDLDNLIIAKYSAYRITIAPSGQITDTVLTGEVRMPASATPRSFKLRYNYTTVNATATILGPSSGSGQFPTPFLQALSL